MLTDKEKEMLDFIIPAYGFLIPYFREVSFADFGSLIRNYYDCVDNPRNAYCAEFVERFSGKIKNRAGAYSATITGRI